MMKHGEMNHEDCHEMLGVLSDYIDGDLGAEFCSAIEQHLSDCENCRVVVDSLRKTVYLYKITSMPATVPSQVRERLFRCLELDEFLGEHK